MNLTKLFETQKLLDQRIIKQHGLEGQDLLAEKILALQVELGELANEWRGFKFWSKDQEPRTEHKVACHACGGKGSFYVGISNDEKEDCLYCEGTGLQEDRNPLLEEYVDCLHFILSIGLEEVEYYGAYVPINLAVSDGTVEIYKELNTTLQFNNMFLDVAALYDATAGGNSYGISTFEESYIGVLGSFLGLGELLGFTWEQIKQAYYDKNEINHTRQDTGY